MPESVSQHACPICAQPMRLLTTLRRTVREDSYVLQCKPCGLSTIQIVNWAKDPQKAAQ